MLESDFEEEDRRLRAKRFQSILLLIVAVLVLILAGGTIYGLATGSRAKKLAREKSGQVLKPGYATFTGIGTVRASTAGDKPAVVVATVSFPYSASDREFKEELYKKAPALREATVNYFASKTAESLAPAYEGTIKAGLRDYLNGLLSLGRIEEIWLSDFSVVQ